MNFTAISNDAPSGARINSTVELLLPEDDEKFARKPWRATSSVDGCTMTMSHHETRAAATAAAEQGQAINLSVHANYPEYRALRDAERAAAAAA